MPAHSLACRTHVPRAHLRIRYNDFHPSGTKHKQFPRPPKPSGLLTRLTVEQLSDPNTFKAYLPKSPTAKPPSLWVSEAPELPEMPGSHHFTFQVHAARILGRGQPYGRAGRTATTCHGVWRKGKDEG